MSPRKIFATGLAVVAVVVLLFLSGSILETMDAEDILVVQSPWKGELTWHTSAGVKWQGFGKVTFYKKRSIYDFDKPVEINETQIGMDGKPILGSDKNPIVRKVMKCQNGIEVRFNDGGHASMCGSMQYDMPLDPPHLTAIHTRFGSQEAVQRQLVETVTKKSVYLSGPLMSSRESYAEKRSDLLFYVEDQIQHGVYKTKQTEVRVKDQASGQEKGAMVVEIVKGNDGRPERQEEEVLSEFGIKAFNFTITRLPYDVEVEIQIRQQQQIAMDVQTAIADSRKAEQRALTVEQQGKANAAQAKWDQEVIKAKEVTAAEQRKRVAELDAQAAEQKKREQILLGEGEGARRRLVMEADGALEIKVKAWLEAQKVWAESVKGYTGNWVPSVVMGSGAATSGSGAQAIVDLLTIKAAKELGLDMNIPKASGRAETKAGGK